MNKDNLEPISGAGGGGKGGGSGRQAQEAANTLRSSATVRVVEVLSEGEIVGICGGAKGIYFDGTPLQSSGGTYNFVRTAWDYRVGLPNQDYMKGYSSVEAETTVGASVIYSTPVIRTVSSAAVDAAKVTIQLPNGLSVQDTSNGDLNGTAVAITIETKLTSSGSWGSAAVYTIEGKTTSPYERQYRVDRPAGAGTWDIRVSRNTADAGSSAVRNSTTWARLTEIQEVKSEVVEYNNSAVVGLAIDAESVGNQIPNRSYLVKGIKVQIPTNYNPVTRLYTGTWNGTFTTDWTDNPAWVLYDLITNSRYGLGAFIGAAQVDKYSFYDAAVYNDAGILYNGSGVYVSGGVSNGAGGYEPRFTFNSVINQRDDAYRILQMVAGAMRGSLAYFNGMITLLQDRPASPVKLITKANVIDGMFDYKSSGLFERHTAVNVTFNDRADRHLQRITTIDSTTTSGAMQTALAASEAKFGYNPVDVAAYGATTEGQAIRHGRWLVDTEQNQTELATWKMSLNGFDLLPGDIVKVYDEDYAATVGGVRVVSVVGTTVVIDRNVTLTSGSTIEVLLADGSTTELKSIVETTGTVNTFTLASTLSTAIIENADAIVTTTAQPRQFKIMAVKAEETNIVAIEAVYHDPNKYARVETGVSIPSPIFTNAASGMMVGACTNMTFKQTSYSSADGVKLGLLIMWDKPATGTTTGYSLKYRRNSGNYVFVGDIGSQSYEITNALPGIYNISVTAVGMNNLTGPELSANFTIDVTAGTGSALNAVTGLQVIGGGTSFVGEDLNIQWTNPSTNNNIGDTVLKDFRVDVLTTADVLLRTEYVGAGTQPGAVCTYNYTYSKNIADVGPRRSVKVIVYARDTTNKVSTGLTVTFANAAPATVTPTVTGAIGTTFIKMARPTDADFVGFLLWGSTTNGFTPGVGNLINEGDTGSFTHSGLASNTTWYYKSAAYDRFSKDYAGTGLNVSVQVAATTLVTPGIPNGASVPGSGAEADLFFNTTDGQLYRYHSGAWTLAVPAVNVTGTLTNAQIADLAATKITGQITTTQITDNSVSTAKIVAGAITAGQIAASTITASQIAANTITAGQIAASTITASQIAANTITAGQIAANTITAGQIAASTITASQIAANTITAGQVVTTGLITASAQINNGVIGTAQIAALAVTGAKIASATITEANITAATITNASIANATITNAKIGTAAIDTLQVAGNAITVLSAATGSSGGTSVTLSLTAGQPVLIAAHVNGAGGVFPGNVTRTGYLSVSGTASATLVTVTGGNCGYNYAPILASLSLHNVYTPGTTGSYTFTVSATDANYGAYITVTNCKR